MNFEGFTSITFPRDDDVVYVLCLRRLGSSEEVPFYVGESRRGTRRLGDYITAQFAAPTDFKVGVVVKTLQDAGAEVTVKYKLSADRKAEEARIIKQVASEHALLNHVSSFNYKTDNREEHLARLSVAGNCSALRNTLETEWCRRCLSRSRTTSTPNHHAHRTRHPFPS